MESNRSPQHIPDTAERNLARKLRRQVADGGPSVASQLDSRRLGLVPSGTDAVRTRWSRGLWQSE
jgi:hypothetical protein